MQLILRARHSGLGSAVALAVAGVVVATTLLTTVTRLRMFELRDNLQALNEKDDDLRNASLLSRLALINQRAFSGSRENINAYRQEAESALIAIRQTQSDGKQATLIDRAALPFLNAFNFVHNWLTVLELAKHLKMSGCSISPFSSSRFVNMARRSAAMMSTSANSRLPANRAILRFCIAASAIQ